ESALVGRLGVAVEVGANDADLRADALLFGEGYSRIVVSVDAGADAEFLRVVRAHDIPVERLGYVVEKEAGFTVRAGGATIEQALTTLADAWYGAIPCLMSGDAV